jgi:hypothetical protein
MANGASVRVLIVSPRFAPSNAADMHRTRLLLTHARASGWEPEVLAIAPECVSLPVDPWLSARIPADIPIHRVRIGTGPARIGLRALWLRSLVALYRRGARLIRSGGFDLVFFSTTEFPLHILGPLWRWRFGIPFCMDFQDPWVNDYYRDHPEVSPPGSRFKHAATDRLHRMLEPLVVRRCDGFIAVSERYLADLARRYGMKATRQPSLVVAFPGEPTEQDALPPPQSDRHRPEPVWRYVGRGGEDLLFGVRAFLQAWRNAEERGETPRDLLFEAIGTSYAPPGLGKPTLRPEALLLGLGERFVEQTERVPYSAALTLMRESDALVVFGSNDPAYTASKIYPYLLARRPLLAIFHEQSSVVRLMAEVGGGVCVTYGHHTSVQDLADRIFREWFSDRRYTRGVALDLGRFEPYTARYQARQLARWFKRVLHAGVAVEPR